ncbi:MAG: hypothetical protein HY782_19965 [Chloroflexi bacterium]|nr:hypothetical protein [Chloroflexota bacterium]
MTTDTNLVDLTHLSPISPDETASLMIITGDQYLLRYREKQGAVAYKFISPAAVRAAFANERIDSTWLPPSARRWGMAKEGEWILLAHPPQRYAVTFTGKESNQVIQLQVPLPALAFIGYAQRYYVWAFPDSELRGETPLFAAPLPNVDANGAICFGNNPVPKASAQTIAEAWQIFLTAPFSNHSMNGKSQKYPDDVREQLLKLAERKRRRYPLDDLIPYRANANQAIEWVLRGIR